MGGDGAGAGQRNGYGDRDAGTQYPNGALHARPTNPPLSLDFEK
jgi:hypothetical protein